jgi:hypothetical protein
MATDTHGVYDGGLIQTGNPLYRKLADTLTVRLQYTLTGEELQAINGVFHMDAVVADGTGWQRHLELSPATPFAGATFSAFAPLNLLAVQAVIDSLEQPTGLKRLSYDVSIQPDIRITGIAGAAMWHDVFTSSLSFKLDKDMLKLAAGTGAGDQLNPLLKGSTNHTVTQLAALPILGQSLPVQTARIAAGVGLGLAVLCGLALLVL